MDRGRLGVVAALGTSQTLAWGSSYYLPAILADPIAHDLGISSNWFFDMARRSRDALRRKHRGIAARRMGRVS